MYITFVESLRAHAVRMKSTKLETAWGRAKKFVVALISSLMGFMTKEGIFGTWLCLRILSNFEL